MSLSQAFRLILLGAIWGGSFLFMRVASPELGAAWTVAIRVFLAAIVLFGLAKMRGVEIDFRSDWKYFVVIGLANSALPYWLFSWAETSLSASVASILNAMSPIFGMLIGAVWLRSPLRPITVVGMIVSFLGVVGLMGFNPAEFGRSGIWPALGCLAATVSYGFAANYTKTRSKAISPLADHSRADAGRFRARGRRATGRFVHGGCAGALFPAYCGYRGFQYVDRHIHRAGLRGLVGGAVPVGATQFGQGRGLRDDFAGDLVGDATGKAALDRIDKFGDGPGFEMSPSGDGLISILAYWLIVPIVIGRPVAE